MAMRSGKKPLREIRTAIDKKYATYGPSTPTPLPPA